MALYGMWNKFKLITLAIESCLIQPLHIICSHTVLCSPDYSHKATYWFFL